MKDDFILLTMVQGNEVAIKKSELIVCFRYEQQTKVYFGHNSDDYVFVVETVSEVLNKLDGTPNNNIRIGGH